MTQTPDSARAERNRSREATATRLLRSSVKNSFDPEVDIDWAAPIEEGKVYLPLERVSLYGTDLWERMTPAQRVELSKHELASIAGTGLWFEMILMQMLLRYAYRRDIQEAHTQYALTEVGDETRHALMFAKAIRHLGMPTYRPPKAIDTLARLYKATASGPMLFAPVLVAEETLDRLQREAMNHPDLDPVVRMVNRIHVVEEARHVRFAREEVARQMPTLRGPLRAWHQLATAVVSSFVVHVMVNPAVYDAVGLDRDEAVKAARDNPHFHETRRWMGEKIMDFLSKQGLVTWFTRPIYRKVHLL